MRSLWPRALELMIAVWLLLSSLLLGGDPATLAVDRFAAAIIGFVVALSTFRRLRFIRLGTVGVAIGLIAWGWLRYPRPGPASAQSEIITGLVVLLLAIVPTDPLEPPEAWRPWITGTVDRGSSVED